MACVPKIQIRSTYCLWEGYRTPPLAAFNPPVGHITVECPKSHTIWASDALCIEALRGLAELLAHPPTHYLELFGNFQVDMYLEVSSRSIGSSPRTSLPFKNYMLGVCRSSMLSRSFYYHPSPTTNLAPTPIELEGLHNHPNSKKIYCRPE